MLKTNNCLTLNAFFLTITSLTITSLNAADITAENTISPTEALLYLQQAHVEPESPQTIDAYKQMSHEQFALSKKMIQEIIMQSHETSKKMYGVEVKESSLADLLHHSFKISISFALKTTFEQASKFGPIPFHHPNDLLAADAIMSGIKQQTLLTPSGKNNLKLYLFILELRKNTGKSINYECIIKNAQRIMQHQIDLYEAARNNENLDKFKEKPIEKNELIDKAYEQFQLPSDKTLDDEFERALNVLREENGIKRVSITDSLKSIIGDEFYLLDGDLRDKLANCTDITEAMKLFSTSEDDSDSDSTSEDDSESDSDSDSDFCKGFTRYLTLQLIQMTAEMEATGLMLSSDSDSDSDSDND
jgi:hypothetical protein